METVKTLEEVTALDSDYRRDTKFVPSTDWTAYFDTPKGDGAQGLTRKVKSQSLFVK